MDSLTQLRLTRELIDIDSTTGREGEAAAWLAGRLRTLGYDVVEQPVSDGRFNVYATAGRPVVVLSTHFDCVPGYFPSREAGGRLHGRGACDAKGIVMAQVAASERLRAAGETRVGLLFVVGEERGSDGAKAANALAPGSRYLVNGEPTDNRLALATRGFYRAVVRAHGRAVHSSRPDLGASAIEQLVDVIAGLRDVSWPADPVLGETSYIVGVVRGGVAFNVVPAEAEAELMFRLVGPHESVETLLVRTVDGRADVEQVAAVPPVRLMTLPGFATGTFSFTTDIPWLDRWGRPLLIGPGSITVAHTDDEWVDIAELDRAVDLYARIARQLLEAPPAP